MPLPLRLRPVWALLAGLSAVIAPAAPLHGGGVVAEIESALRLPPGDQTVVGVRVVELPSARTIYSSGANLLFKPASNMKLLTTAAAIHVLGPDYQFRTECHRQGENLVVLGGGDPLFAYPSGPADADEQALEVFYHWADHFLAQGITCLAGDLIIDDSIFDSMWTNPAWPQEQLQEHYCAPVGGLNLHGNCIRARVMPGRRIGDPVDYLLIPSNPWITVENRCRTANSGPPWMSRKRNGAGFLLAGKCQEPTTLGRLAVHDPGLFFGTTWRAYLAAKGIRLQGQVRRANHHRPGALGTAHSGSAYPPAVHLTPLKDVLKRANTDSLNLAAEALLKMTGLQGLPPELRASTPGSWASGRAAVRSFLQRAGLDDPRLVIADGSGLSHDNRLTPESMTGLLVHMFNSPHRNLYLDSLARSGLEGTLRSRMKDLPGRFLGKTGYIDGVRALSGYLQTDDGTWLAVSMMHNGFTGSSLKYRQAQEKVCRILTSYGRAAGPG